MTLRAWAAFWAISTSEVFGNELPVQSLKSVEGCDRISAFKNTLWKLLLLRLKHRRRCCLPLTLSGDEVKGEERRGTTKQLQRLFLWTVYPHMCMWIVCLQQYIWKQSIECFNHCFFIFLCLFFFLAIYSFYFHWLRSSFWLKKKKKKTHSGGR